MIWCVPETLGLQDLVRIEAARVSSDDGQSQWRDESVGTCLINALSWDYQSKQTVQRIDKKTHHNKDRSG